MNINFLALTDYTKPYSRVRCYNFARYLKDDFNARAFSFQENFTDIKDGARMLDISLKKRVFLNARAFSYFYKKKKDVFYMQKIHYHSAFLYLYSKFFGAKYIVDYDDYDFDRSPFFNPFLNKLFFGAASPEKITENVSRSALFNVASSENLKKIMEEFNKTYLIQTGVDLNKFKFNETPPKENFNFVWNGMVWGEAVFNNVSFICDCFIEALKEYKNIRLNIAGDGEYYGKLKEKYSFLPQIKFQAFIQPDSMPDFLREQDAGLLPLLPDKKNYKWFECKSPTKLFEYMAVGLPSVCSAFGEVLNVIEDKKDGILAENKNGFINGMKELIKNKELYEKIKHNARGKAEKKYSLFVLTGKLAAILKEEIK